MYFPSEILICMNLSLPKIPYDILWSFLDACRVKESLSTIFQSEENNRGRPRRSSPLIHCDCLHTLSLLVKLKYNRPSLHSKITEFVSIASKVCHTPFRIFTPYLPSSGHSTTLLMILPSSLCVVTFTLSLKITNVSSFVGCL